MRRGGHPGLLAQRLRLRCHLPFVGPMVLAAAVGALPVLVLPRLRSQATAPVQFDAEDDGGAASDQGGVASFLRSMRSAIEPFQKQVDEGQIVPKFGEKAHVILSALVGRAGDAGPELERVVDGMLYTLFLRQLALIRQQMTSKFEKVSRSVEAVSQADQQFVAQAEELRRPDSDWSYEQERYALRAVLEGNFRREAAIQAERVLAAQTQQSTVEIISKLQSQMESLQQKVQAMRQGSPWFLSSSYRIPKTPFQLIGRYQQGRANLELSLNPDKDPANSEAGFVEGFWPKNANLGVSLNLGM